MSDNDDELRKQVASLQRELAELKQKHATLEHARNGSGADHSDLPVAISEFEETLRRLVQRTAMIVQSEKCVIMVRDRESGDLVARSPAFGMNEEEVQKLRVPPDR